EDFGVRQAQELAKIDAVETAAWAAWERSQHDAEIRLAETTHCGGSQQTRASKKTANRAGDASFLESIVRCIALRCKLLGLFKERSGPSTAVTVINQVDLAAIIGAAPGLPYEVSHHAESSEQSARPRNSGFQVPSPPSVG